MSDELPRVTLTDEQDQAAAVMLGAPYIAFRSAARALKQAEEAVAAARQAYAEAVKALSEEAVK